MEIHKSFCLLVLACCLESSPATVPLSSLRTDTLLCHFCPLLESCGRVFPTRCPPDEVCAVSGVSGGGDPELALLPAQGCIKRDLCGAHEVKFRLGRAHNVTHACCCEDMCNHRPSSEDAGLGTMKGTKDNSCANYTLPLAAKPEK